MRKQFFIVIFMLLMPFSVQSAEYSWENDVEKEITLASLKGKPVVLHFWASWCPPCRSEMPALINWIEKNPEVKVVVVSLDRERDSAKDFFDEQGIKLPLNMGNMGAASRLGVRGLPTTIVVGADSEIKKRYIGDVDWADAKVSKEVLHWL